jgi:hypothetical protein
VDVGAQTDLAWPSFVGNTDTASETEACVEGHAVPCGRYQPDQTHRSEARYYTATTPMRHTGLQESIVCGTLCGGQEPRRRQYVVSISAATIPSNEALRRAGDRNSEGRSSEVHQRAWQSVLVEERRYTAGEGGDEAGRMQPRSQ